MRLYKSKKIISTVIVMLIIMSTNVFADFQGREPTESMKNFIQNLDTNEKKPPKKPSSGQVGESSSSSKHTPDEIINEANSFIQKGQNGSKTIDVDSLKQGSDTLYNILLAIGIFLTVAIGMYLGIKFMLASAEDKAKVKEALIPYIAGCVVIFGAFVIWKLVIMLLGGIA